MSGSERDEGFLRRWSRRKAEARESAVEGGAQPPAENEADPAAPPVEAPPPEELPDPETLGPDDDFTVFLREGVPEALRHRALRVLWRSDPVLANLDGLNDYDGDFSTASRAMGEAVRTAWRVGRGYAAEDKEAEDHQAAADQEEQQGEDPLVPRPQTDDESAESSPDDGAAGLNAILPGKPAG